MLINLRFSRAVLLATTAIVGSAGFASEASAIPYSVITGVFGYTNSTAILGVLNGSGSGGNTAGGIGGSTTAGIAPSAVATLGTGTATYTQAYNPAGPTAIYVGNSNATASNDAAIVLGQTTANSKTVSIGTGGSVVFQTRNTTAAPETLVKGTSPNTTSLHQTLSFGATVYNGGTTSVGTSSIPFVTATTRDVITPVTGQNAVISSAVANISTVGATTSLTATGGNGGVQGVVNQISHNTSWDTTLTGNVATSAPIAYNMGRGGYAAINIAGQLTTTLTISGTRMSDYMFIYLSGGIGAGGSITLASTGNLLQQQNVIVVIPNGVTNNTLSTTGNDGTFILGGGDSLTFADGATLIGGVFLSNTAGATSPSELIFAGNATITPQAWNGWIASGAPEPVSMALLGTGLFGMAFTRRRRKA